MQLWGWLRKSQISRADHQEEQAGNSQGGAVAEVHGQNFFFFSLRVLNGLKFELNLIIESSGKSLNEFTQ